MKKAKEKNLAIQTGFCWRYNFAERATWKKMHEGFIGDIRAWKALVAQDSGYSPTDAYCNETVMDYLLGNDDVSAFLGEGPLRATLRYDGDAFDLDNTAYAYLPGKGRVRVALVTAGAPVDTRLPFRSAKVLIGLSARTTTWTISG